MTEVNMTMTEIAEADDAAFGVAQGSVKVALEMIERAAEATDRDLPDLFAEFTLAPDVLGQFLMNVLTCGERMSLKQKEYWLRVGDHMGQDYIEGLKQAAAFTDKFDKF
jgi:hypothetical protein